jgi:transposase
MARRQMTYDERVQMLSDIKSGMPYRKIAQKYNRNFATVWRLHQRYRETGAVASSARKRASWQLTFEERKKLCKRMSLEERRNVIEDTKKGLSVTKISEKYDFSQQAIRRLQGQYQETGSFEPKKRDYSNLSEEERRKRGRQIPLGARKKMVKDYDNGSSVKDLRETYGFSESSINRLILHYIETGDTVPKKRFMTEERFEVLRGLILTNPDITLDEVRTELGW